MKRFRNLSVTAVIMSYFCNKVIYYTVLTRTDILMY